MSLAPSDYERYTANAGCAKHEYRLSGILFDFMRNDSRQAGWMIVEGQVFFSALSG
jgi:hypothetical protein